MQSRLSHECKKSRGLQGHGLSAGVRPCDDEKIILIAESDVHGDSLLRVKKRMSCFFESDHTVIVVYRSRCVYLNSISTFCKYKIKFGYRFDIRFDLLSMFTAFIGQL